MPPKEDKGKGKVVDPDFDPATVAASAAAQTAQLMMANEQRRRREEEHADRESHFAGAGGPADGADGADELAAPDAQRRRPTEPEVTTGRYKRIMEVVFAKKIARLRGIAEEVTFRDGVDPDAGSIRAFLMRIFDGKAYLTAAFEAELFETDIASHSVIIRSNLHVIVHSAEQSWCEKTFISFREARPLFSDLTKLEAARLMYLAYCLQRKQPGQDPYFPKLSEIYMKSQYVMPPTMSMADARDRQTAVLTEVGVRRMPKSLPLPPGVPDYENDFLNSMRKGILEHVEQMFRDKRVNTKGKIPDVLVSTFMLIFEMVEAIRTMRGTDIQEAFYIAEELEAFCLRLLNESNFFISNGVDKQTVPVLDQKEATKEVFVDKALDFSLINRIQLSVGSLLVELQAVLLAPDFEQYVQLVTQKHAALLREFELVMEEVRHMLTPPKESEFKDMRPLDRVLACHDLSSSAVSVDPFARYPWYKENLLPLEQLLFRYVALQKKATSKSYRRQLMELLGSSGKERESRKRDFNKELDSPFIDDGHFLVKWQKLVVAAFDPLKQASMKLHESVEWIGQFTTFLSKWLNDFVKLMDFVNRNFYNLKLFLNVQSEAGELLMLFIIHEQLVAFLDDSIDMLKVFQHSVRQLILTRKELLRNNPVASSLFTTGSELRAARSLQNIINHLDLVISSASLELLNALDEFKRYITVDIPVIGERVEQLKQVFKAVGYVDQRLQGSALRLLPSVGYKNDPVMRKLIAQIQYRHEHPLPVVTFGRRSLALTAADSLIPVEMPSDDAAGGSGQIVPFVFQRQEGGGAGDGDAAAAGDGAGAPVGPSGAAAEKPESEEDDPDSLLLRQVATQLELPNPQDAHVVAIIDALIPIMAPDKIEMIKFVRLSPSTSVTDKLGMILGLKKGERTSENILEAINKYKATKRGDAPPLIQRAASGFFEGGGQAARRATPPREEAALVRVLTPHRYVAARDDEPTRVTSFTDELLRVLRLCEFSLEAKSHRHYGQARPVCDPKAVIGKFIQDTLVTPIEKGKEQITTIITRCLNLLRPAESDMRSMPWLKGVYKEWQTALRSELNEIDQKTGGGSLCVHLPELSNFTMWATHVRVYLAVSVSIYLLERQNSYQDPDLGAKVAHLLVSNVIDWCKPRGRAVGVPVDINQITAKMTSPDGFLQRTVNALCTHDPHKIVTHLKKYICAMDSRDDYFMYQAALKKLFAVDATARPVPATPRSGGQP